MIKSHYKIKWITNWLLEHVGQNFRNIQKEPTDPEIYPGLNRAVNPLLLEHAPVISSLNHIVNSFHLADFLNCTVCESAEEN